MIGPALSASALLAVLSALAAGCVAPPGGAREAGAGRPPEGGAEAGPLEVELALVRPFGEQGEEPVALTPTGPERLAVLTRRATYLLDLEGRVLARTPLPRPSSGAPLEISSSVWDGEGLGLALRWPADAHLPAGNYFALSDGEGAITPASMMRLGPPAGAARGDFDGERHLVVWPSPGGSGVELHLDRISRAGAAETRLLCSGLPAGSSPGALRASPRGGTLCTVEADRVMLRSFEEQGPPAALAVSESGRAVSGSCQLAGSGRSHLVTWRVRALPPAQVDAGARDLGLAALSFDQPVGRVAAGGALAGGPHRLSDLDATLRVEDLLWDGARYLVLLDAAGVRGGRLLLAVLDESGAALARDLLIPLSYEPGTLLAARLALTPAGYALVFAVRRPWDEGILQLAIFSLRGPPADGR